MSAFQEIEDAINHFSDNDYPLLTKADLAVHFRNIEKLREAVVMLESKLSRRAQSYRSFLRFKAYLIALDDDAVSAKKFVEKNLTGLGKKAMDRMVQKIDELANPITSSY